MNQHPIGLRGTAHTVTKTAAADVAHLGAYTVLNADGVIIGYVRKGTDSHRGWWIGSMGRSCRTTDVSRTVARVAANIADRDAAKI